MRRAVSAERPARLRSELPPRPCGSPGSRKKTQTVISRFQQAKKMKTLGGWSEREPGGGTGE